jgi:hypothetical protein
MNDVFDIDQPKDENLVEKVRSACEEAVELQETIISYNSAASIAQKRLTELTQRLIPMTMAEAGMGDVFSLDTGHKIKIHPFVAGSLPKEQEPREKAFEILESIGGGALIKTNVSMVFAKGEKDIADRVSELLYNSGFEFNKKEDIHAGSLKAFIKEKLADGSEVPLDALGLYNGNVAKITPPKEGKK